jgi:hypothetical protein
MGKIRVKGFDEATPEEEAKLKAKKEAKKAEKMAAKNAQRASEGKKVNPQSEEMIASITTDEPKSTEATVEEKVTVETVEEEKPARLAEDETKPAKQINDKENSQYFLENYAIDSLYLYAPVVGSELSCSPLIWTPSEVFKDIDSALEANIGLIKVKGDYYSGRIDNMS